MAGRPAYPQARARLAQLVRLVLPLGAIALLSTVFLLSENIDPQRAVDMAGLDVADLTREPRIGTARVAGVTEEGTALTIRAVTMRAQSDLSAPGPILLSLDTPEGDMLFTSGRLLQFRGNSGEVDQAQDQMVLRGDVVLETSDGYRATMPVLRGALKRAHLLGEGGISASGPPGVIRADRLDVTGIAGSEGGYLLAFRGNVRLIYQPDD